MSAHAHAEHTAADHGDDHGDHHDVNYVKIYFILLALLVVSILGPELGNHFVTLVTAFGIAGVKAYLVCAHFMHLKQEKRYISYLLAGMVVFMLLFFAGTAPDVMKHEGQNWKNMAAEAEVTRAMGVIAEREAKAKQDAKSEGGAKPAAH